MGNSNKARKNYSKYSLHNPLVGQHIMNVKNEKKSSLATIPIMFIDENEVGVNYPHDDALVVTLEVRSSKISKTLVDTGSLVDIIFKDTLDTLNIENLKTGPVKTMLYGFAESYIFSLGSIQLPLTMRGWLYQNTTIIKF